MSAITELVTNRSGVKQFRRHWKVAESPRTELRAAMLIVHGICEHSARYAHVAEHFVHAGIDVLAFDLRGHGETQGRRGYVDRFDHMLDDVEELLEERRSHGVPVVLLGHSLGGLICTAYATTQRPQPDLLVLSAPALAANVPGWQRLMAPVFSCIAPILALPSDFDGALLSGDPDVGEAYRADPLRVTKTTARLGNEIFSAMDHTNRDLSKIRIPTYVFHGTADELVPPSASAPLAELPGVTRVLHPKLRHECLNEPERADVLRGIDEWLAPRIS